MPSVRRKSATRRRIIQTAKRATPIPIAVASYSLAEFSGTEPIPTWVPVAMCVACALFAVVDKITDFFLKLVIIRGYREDHRRSDADDYVTMFRELNQR
ncbi:hypothetical protein GCM10009780_43480 [Actinomadura alba]